MSVPTEFALGWLAGVIMRDPASVVIRPNLDHPDRVAAYIAGELANLPRLLTEVELEDWPEVVAWVLADIRHREAAAAAIAARLCSLGAVS